jgi:hypothetical protein
MYTLEYTTNKGIMNLFGPRTGRSLFSDRNVEIKCRFQLQVRDNRFIFDNGSGKILYHTDTYPAEPGRFNAFDRAKHLCIFSSSISTGRRFILLPAFFVQSQIFYRYFLQCL